MEQKEVSFKGLSQCARYGKVSRNSIYLAIKRKTLKATKKGRNWIILKSDYDEYRTYKYNYQTKKVQGEMVFDHSQGHFSIQQVSQVISHCLKKHYPVQRIYYLLRKGTLKGIRKGNCWVIKKEDATYLLHEELAKNE